MRRSVSHVSRRGGFTLVELLVVITIIAILFALLSAAAVKLIGKGDETKLRSEISQLAQAVQAFKQQFAVGHVPDQVVLPPGADPTTAQYFKSVWPRLNASVMLNDNTSHAYWGVPSGQTFVLHGDQALVFWLGGTRDSTGNCIGWSTDNTDPMKQSGSRISPFFTFPAERLRVFVGSPQPEVSGLPSRAQNFPSFVDVYGAVPYLYFSTGKSDNTYTSAIAAPNPLYASNPAPYNTPFIRVDPYALSSTRFANATSFQIISAGKDQLIGQGNIRWAGAVGGAATQQSADDVANFHPTFLGVPNQ